MLQAGPPAVIHEDLVGDILPSDPPLSHIKKSGIYKRAVLMQGDRPRFTRGLRWELERLRDNPPGDDLRNGALPLLMPIDSGPPADSAARTADPNLVEVVPLNDEQRDVVRSAFRKSLTVVTGPPGTGKSQVVTALIANAYLRGETVLFASRNNKAVDVVEQRVNALAASPVLLRTGGTVRGALGGDRRLKTELIDFLTRILSVPATAEDRRAYRHAEKTYDELAHRRDGIWNQVEEIRTLRNDLDALDRSLSPVRDAMPPESWDAVGAARAALPEAYVQVTRAHAVLSPYLTSARNPVARFLRSIRRRRASSQLRSSASAALSLCSLLPEPPAYSLAGHGVRHWRAWLDQVETLLGVADQAARYYDALERLNALPPLEDLERVLGRLEEELADAGQRRIVLHARLLPERLDDGGRAALGQLRVIVEQLAGPQLPGRQYANLQRELVRIFPTVARFLPAWAVGNLSARGNIPFAPALFDLLIIDEASQCDIPSAIPLLFRARRAVIIGDPNQLRHIATVPRQKEAQLQAKYGLLAAQDQPHVFSLNSLFDLAATHTGPIGLRDHFRSDRDIIQFSNQHWYKESLRIWTDYRCLKRPDREPAVRWTDVRGRIIRPNAGGAICHEEAKAIVDAVEDLVVHRKFLGTVGIASPFRAQANRIRDLVTERVPVHVIAQSQLIVDTAHGFQGDERDVMFFSPCVGADLPPGARWFLETTGNLFNVSITRARAALHVIGNLDASLRCDILHVQQFAEYYQRLQSDTSPPDPTTPPPTGAVQWDSPWEPVLHDALLAAGLKPMPQYKIDQYRLDFAIKHKDSDLDIEVDGEYYHKEWDGSRCREDIRRDIRMMALGWTVKRVWVYRVRDDLDGCVREVLDLLGKTPRSPTGPAPPALQNPP